MSYFMPKPYNAIFKTNFQLMQGVIKKSWQNVMTFCQYFKYISGELFFCRRGFIAAFHCIVFNLL